VKFDCVIIGAGAAGMSAALILARAGQKVALVEKAARTAPVLRGFRRQGVQFYTGFHYTGGLGEGEPLDLFFRHLGLAGRLEKKAYDPDGFDVIRDAGRGGGFAFPYGFERLRARLAEAFPAARGAIDRYLAEIEAVCERSPYLSLKGGVDRSRDRGGIYGPSLRQVLDGLTGDARLKELLCHHAILYGVAPEEIPFARHACVVGPFYRSVYGLKGGGLSLVAAYDAALAEAGVKVFCGRGARAIEAGSAGGLRGVRLEDGEVLETRCCIATVHPRNFLEMAPEGLYRPALRRRLEDLGESQGAYLFYARCNGPLPQLEGRNLYLVPGPPVAGQGTDLLYLAAAAEGNGLVAVCPAPPEWTDPATGRTEGYARFKEEAEARVLSHIEAGCPELAGRLQMVASATPLTLRDYAHTPAGGLYGVKHMIGQYNPLPVTKVEGLYVAGQAVVAPGVLGAVLSAFLACGTILGHERLVEEVRGCA